MSLPEIATAQVEQGRVTGQVADQQDAAIPKATVKLTNLGTNVVQAATSDANGNYTITTVPGGSYTLTVSAPGFATTTTSAFQVQVGQFVREDVPLQIGSASTTVEVTTAAAPLLTTESATEG